MGTALVPAKTSSKLAPFDWSPNRVAWHQRMPRAAFGEQTLISGRFASPNTRRIEYLRSTAASSLN
jgi:hypothetical protein